VSQCDYWADSHPISIKLRVKDDSFTFTYHDWCDSSIVLLDEDLGLDIWDTKNGTINQPTGNVVFTLPTP
jgi:hypothetical protein